MSISERKKRILAAVVDEYIRTAEPVGSKHLAENAGLGCSSATIRNELAELVALGYLEQPHTSAGRVPTPMGYRLYVNELMSMPNSRNWTIPSAASAASHPRLPIIRRWRLQRLRR